MRGGLDSTGCGVAGKTRPAAHLRLRGRDGRVTIGAKLIWRPAVEQSADIDLPAHERTYARFTRLFKYGAIAAFVVAVFVVLIIS